MRRCSTVPRKRRNNERWPPYVNISKGRIVWRPYLGCENGKPRFAKEVVLFRRTDVRDVDVWEEYNRRANDGPQHGTIEWLIDRFLDSVKFKRLAERTQYDYRKYAKAIKGKKAKGGRRFAEAKLNTITVRTVNSYLSTHNAPVQANRHMAMLSSAWNWVSGEERLPPNPIPGCRWNPEKAKTRYVEDWEYDAVYKEAGPNLQVAMELIYLCRLRKCEAIALETLRDCREDGLLARRRKGSKHQVIELSDRLEAAIKKAKDLHGGIVRHTLLVNRRQMAYTSNGLPRSLWGACERAIEKGTLQERFTLHDLKRKGVSDFEGTETEKLDSAGHRDRRTAEIYNVKPGKTRSTR